MVGHQLPHVPASVLAELRRRYAEPQRAYHDWRHVEALLTLFEEAKPLLSDPTAVLYAVLFHDAVYDPTRTDNEDRSADLLRASLAGTLDASTSEQAVSLVLATKKHVVPEGLDDAGRSDAAIFLDMDLSILGADELRFDAYEGEIRAEYGHVLQEQFRAGRTRALETFASRDRLYLSDWGHARFEAQARRNIARSLSRLRALSA